MVVEREEALPLADCPFPAVGLLSHRPKGGSTFSTPERVPCSGSGLRVKPPIIVDHVWGECYLGFYVVVRNCILELVLGGVHGNEIRFCKG